MLQDYRAVARVALTRALYAFAIGLSMVTWGGCAKWQTEPDTELARGGLPPVQISDEVAILEVAFVRIPETYTLDSGTLDSGGEVLWDRMDEMIIPSEVRERLANNGIRVGRLLSIEPGQLGEPPGADDSTRLMEETDVASDFEHRLRRISCRDGQPYKLAVRRPSGENVSILIRTEAGVVGRSLSDPQFMLTLRTRALDDGRIAVRLVPEIQHGEVQQNFVSSDLAFRMEFQRDRWALAELMCEVPLSEGQAMVIMPSEETFGLGKQMFVGKRADLSQERVAVVVRLRRPPQHRIGT